MRYFSACLVCASIFPSLTTLHAEQGKRGRMLMLTQSAGFKHSSVTRPATGLSPAERAMTDLGISSGVFRVDCTQDAAKDVTKDKLQAYDILMFYTTGDLPIRDADRDYLFTEWVKQKGHGFIGAHSAADTYHNYEPYWEMLGGTFVAHPWSYKDTVAITVHDTKHPVSRPWGEHFEIMDEIYQFNHWQPEKVRVLMSLDMEHTKIKKPFHVPIAWVKNYGDGRVLHMSLGHREDVWTNEKYLASLLGGVKWILGSEEGDATPNPQVSAAEEAKARKAFASAQPHATEKDTRTTGVVKKAAAAK